MRQVHIKICDTGWIIETMAKHLADAMPGVRYSLDDPPPCDLAYYLPYLTLTTVPRCPSVGYFTHRETDEVRGSIFDRNAGLFTHNICQSERTAQLLRQRGHTNLSIISPGVDLELFTPELRIGIVGRTYDSGRKGEALVAEMMKLPGIRWFFTGRGWPGISYQFTQEEMPAFYRMIDYLLVPSTNEGGPMCVLEALACGKEVIAPPVGWVTEFPHIPYRVGDAESLRQVLLRLQARQQQLRESVLTRTWANWVTSHDELFTKLLSREGDAS